jgi:flagellar secretion chaperone FliS
MSHPARTYRQFSIRGATPLGLVVMLYDGAIAALQRAIVAIEAHDISEKCTHLTRAQAIILQLEGTLNFAAGGEVAQTLKALYVYARAEMMKANVENSSPILRSLLEKIVTVREAWYEADHRPSASSAESASGGPVPESPGEVRRESPNLPSKPTGEASPYAPSPDGERRSWSLSA